MEMDHELYPMQSMRNIAGNKDKVDLCV